MAESVGRPQVMTEVTLQKLEQIFAIGGTDTEACFYAGIAPSTLYNYQNEHPKYLERKEALKEQPILKARQTVVKALDLPQHAHWYLERKKKKEFGNAVDITTDGEKIVNTETASAIKELTDKLNTMYGGQGIHGGTSVGGNGGESSTLGTETPNKE